MKASKYFVVASILFLSFCFSLNNNLTSVEAMITDEDLRIPVVRPSWWPADNSWQVLRCAPSADDLVNNVVGNLSYVPLSSFSNDPFYGGGGFTQYNVDGVAFFDVPIPVISGKYFDLARISSTDGTEENANKAIVLNRTIPELYEDELNHKIWRVDNDWNTIFRPEGLSAESRNVSNPVIDTLLYGYITCSISIHNGYSAFSSLDTNFNLTERDYTEEDTVLDFVSVSDYSIGRGIGVTVLTSDKVAMMDLMNDVPEGIYVKTLDKYYSKIELLTIFGVTYILILIFIANFRFSRRFIR